MMLSIHLISGNLLLNLCVIFAQRHSDPSEASYTNKYHNNHLSVNNLARTANNKVSHSHDDKPDAGILINSRIEEKKASNRMNDALDQINNAVDQIDNNLKMDRDYLSEKSEIYSSNYNDMRGHKNNDRISKNTDAEKNQYTYHDKLMSRPLTMQSRNQTMTANTSDKGCPEKADTLKSCFSHRGCSNCLQKLEKLEEKNLAKDCYERKEMYEYCGCEMCEEEKNATLHCLCDSPLSPAESNNTLASIIASTFLFFLVFGLSATVPVRQLKQQLTNKWALVTGAGMQFLVMPLMGFLSVIFFKNVAGDDFTKPMGLTLMVVTASPGGSYSNWWCSLFNADLPLSIAMTAVSTILSLAMLPLNLLAYSHLAYGMHDNNADNIVEALDFKTLFISLGVVMTALLSGLYSSYKLDSDNFKIWANRGASLSGIGLIVTSALLSSGTETNFWNMDWKFYVGVAFPCLIGLVLANVFSITCAGLKKPECVAIAIECCYQNIGIAMSVAVTMFQNREESAQALAVPIFYGFVQTIAVASYSVLSWKAGWTKAPANERLCVVISKTYEVADSSDKGNNSTKSLKDDDELE